MDGDRSVAASADVFAEQLAMARPAVFRFAVSLTSLDEADDLVQDALARAWAKREHYDPRRGSTQAWTLAILADLARARWRRRRPTEVHLRSDLHPAPMLDAAAAAVALDVARAVNALPPRQRLAVVLAVYVDLPLADVAAVMGCSLGTVKATMHTARQHLAVELGATYALDR